MSLDAEVFEKLMASEEAKRAYQDDPIFRHVIDVVRAHVAQGADPLEMIGKALASLSESRRRDTDREVLRRREVGARSTLRPWW